MALFPAGASLVCYYPRNNLLVGGTTILGSLVGGITWLSAARAGKPTRLTSGNLPPSYPNGTNPPVAVGGVLPVPATPAGYVPWGIRRITGSDWMEIGDIVSIDSPVEKTASAPITVLKSGDTAREFIPGFSDGDTVKVKARYSTNLFDFLGANPFPAGGSAVDFTIRGALRPGGGLRRLTTWWAIVLPTNFQEGEVAFGSQIAFGAFVTETGPQPFSADDDKVIDLDFSLKVTGRVQSYSGA